MPLMERLKFLAIFTSNLDEFFTIRVAGLHDQVDAGLQRPRARRAHAVAGHRRAARAHRRAQRAPDALLAGRGAPGAGRARHRIVAIDEVDAEEREALDERFRRQIFPVLTPLAVGLGRPFPYISNLSLSLAVLVRDPQTQVDDLRAREGAQGDAAALRPGRARARRRSSRSRSSSRPTSTRSSPGWRSSTTASSASRATPTSTISDEADDLLRAVEAELRRRRFGEVVRLEVDSRDERRRCASELTAGARGRGAPGLRHRRAARPHRPVADRQAAGLQRPARHAVDAGDPAAPAGRGRRPRRHLQRHPRRRRARPPPLRLVRRPRSSASSSRRPTTPTSSPSR